MERLTKNNYKELLVKERSNNFTFLEDYNGCNTPILCKCNTCGNEWNVRPRDLIFKHTNCPKCSKLKQSKEFTKDISYYENKIKEHYGYEPYTFLTEYTGIHDKIKVRCNTCGDEFETCINNLMNNLRLNRKPYCKKCNSERIKENNKIISKENTEKFTKKLDEYFGKEHSYEVLSEYKSSKENITVKCKDCGNIFDVKPQNITYTFNKFGKKYCPYCNKKVHDKRTYEERLKDITNNIINIEPYVNGKTKIIHKCLLCNNEWYATPNSILNGSSCPNCYSGIMERHSNNKKILINYLNQLGIKYIEDFGLENKETLDIYIPDKNIAFEIDDTYSHCDRFKNKKYHLNKTLNCQDKGIRLIHIFDDEFFYKKDILFSKIRNILNLDKDLPRVFARKCTIKEIDSKIKNEFLDANHIQGADQASIKLGLFYEDKLVSVMTFCKPRKALGHTSNTGYDYELSRFASDINSHVVGGFSKLFKYFERNYDWNKIVTYADRRWSQGNVYLKNGFILDHYSEPNYWYSDKNCKKLIHRFNFRKQRLEALFPDIYSDDKTEFQIMNEAEYRRIFDCGNIVFLYYKNN